MQIVIAIILTVVLGIINYIGARYKHKVLFPLSLFAITPTGIFVAITFSGFYYFFIPVGVALVCGERGNDRAKRDADD